MAANGIDPSYVKGLLNTIGKAYHLPGYRSNGYQSLKSKIENLFQDELTGKLNRQDVYLNLAKILESLQLKPPTEGSGRAQERLGTIVKFLEGQNFVPSRILDIGAGKGDITLAVQDYYHLSSESVFAIDQKLPEIPSITPLTYIENRIPLPNESVNLILMFELLHHVPPEAEFSRAALIAEAARVLAPGGYLILRDHDDTQTDAFYVFLDLLHLIWYVAMNETSDPLYLISQTDLVAQFGTLGLQSIDVLQYREPNPQRIYHELFRKEIPTPIYKFADDGGPALIQNYLNQLRGISDPSWDEVPIGIRSELQSKYMESGLSTGWGNVIREVGVALIVQAAQYVVPIGQTYYLTEAAVQAVLESWNK